MPAPRRALQRQSIVPTQVRPQDHRSAEDVPLRGYLSFKVDPIQRAAIQDGHFSRCDARGQHSHDGRREHCCEAALCLLGGLTPRRRWQEVVAAILPRSALATRLQPRLCRERNARFQARDRAPQTSEKRAAGAMPIISRTARLGIWRAACSGDFAKSNEQTDDPFTSI